MSDDANTICRDLEDAVAKRANWDSLWDEIAYRVLPSSVGFTVQTEEGQRREDRAFDTTAITACSRFAAFISEGATPRDQTWHGLEPEDEDLQDDQECKEFLERLTKALFARRYRPEANFVSQRQENYLSLGAFGNYSLFIDEEIGRGNRYRALPMREVYWIENHQGVIYIQFRKYQLTARQAYEQFRELAPPQVKYDAEKNPNALHDFIHCVRPNDELKPGRRDWRGMPWASYHVYPRTKSVISRGGFWTWPFANGRFMKGVGETYARSPAVIAFPSILTVNEQKKTVLRAGQKAVDPPVLLTEDGILDGFNMRSGALNYGALSDQGTPLVQAFNSQARVDIGVELMELEQRAINEAFLVSLFQILAEKPDMTATEVLARLEEKAQLLSPTTARLEAEDLGPMIAREIDLYVRSSEGAWVLEEMPEQLRERGGAYQIVYRSPLARARRAAEALAITRTMDLAGAAAAIDPRAALVIDVEESIRALADIHGMPTKLLRTREQVEALMRQREQVQALAAVAQAAPNVARSAKDLAQAEQIRQSIAA